jgi:hypothetical protein
MSDFKIVKVLFNFSTPCPPLNRLRRGGQGVR